ncbi:RapZ C-terminal domain-containing protein [Streptomyces microflavus]|uniref:RapZ C-terminal domain-containing protein n=1 Tax=Streptomyces microflavus TaxID=1919 RepID=UPI0036E9591B
MTTITITSFGTGHHDDPRSANPVVVDTKPLRNPPEDPAVRARMTQMTGLDRDVAFYVMTTPGAERLAEEALLAVFDRLLTQPDTDVDVHVSCVGGRHRSVAISEELASRLRALDAVTADVQVVHRHIDRPILPTTTDITEGHA